MENVALALWPAKESKATIVGRMGGLPRLTTVADWPTSERNGLPFSFMFDVDLALLPPVDRPERDRFQDVGLVSFFAGLNFSYYENQCVGGAMDGFRLLYRADADIDSRPCEEPDSLPQLGDPNSILMPPRNGWGTLEHCTLLPEVPLRVAQVQVQDGEADVAALHKVYTEFDARGRPPGADTDIEVIRDWAVFLMLHSNGEFSNAEAERLDLVSANSEGLVFFSGEYPPVGSLGPNEPFVDVVVHNGADGKFDWSTAKAVADVT